MAHTATGRRIRKRKLKAEINVVPYIDVMLVLLIIFMVTAPLLNLGVDVELPQADAKPIEQKKDPVIVGISQAGQYTLTLPGADKPRELTPEQLVAEIGAYHRNNRDVAVLVAGDRDARYETVLQAFALLQTEAKVERVGLLSAPTEASGR
jgi:biopolymer transport protein TolR